MPFDLAGRVTGIAALPQARCAAVQPAISRSAEVIADDPDIAAVPRPIRSLLPRSTSGATHTLIGDHHVRSSGPGLRHQYAPSIVALAEVFVDPGASTGCSSGSRGQAQIDRAAGLVTQPCALVRIALAVALHIVERPFHDHAKFVGEGRLERAQPVLGSCRSAAFRWIDGRRLPARASLLRACPR